MKVLVAPLNWGLGHASRCIPLIQRYLDSGDQVVLGGSGDSLLLLKQRFPSLRTIALAPLSLHYSATSSQVSTLLRQLPQLLRFVRLDHYLLRELLEREHFDLVLSDNRFGLFSRHTRCIYITHQLRILLPHPWHWLQPLAHGLHALFYRRYSEVWVPDYATNGLSGWLSHGCFCHRHIRYIGPLSRFAGLQVNPCADYDVVAILSGLEPQRSMLEQTILARYEGKQEKVLLVRGLLSAPATCSQHANLTLVPHLDDQTLAAYLLGSTKIIARSGYSTIMDLEALGLLSRSELIPTPGQTEQEYLVYELSRTSTNRP